MYSSLYLFGLEDHFSATKDVVVHVDTFLDLLKVTVSISEVSSCDYSNHFGINSAWKSLVATCSCVRV